MGDRHVVANLDAEEDAEEVFEHSDQGVDTPNIAVLEVERRCVRRDEARDWQHIPVCRRVDGLSQITERVLRVGIADSGLHQFLALFDQGVLDDRAQVLEFRRRAIHRRHVSPNDVRVDRDGQLQDIPVVVHGEVVGGHLSFLLVQVDFLCTRKHDPTGPCRGNFLGTPSLSLITKLTSHQ